MSQILQLLIILANKAILFYIKMHDIKWQNGFESWDLKRIEVPMDGNCLFHAIAMAFFKPYIDEVFNGIAMSRLQMIKNLRHELSEKLSQPIKGSEKTCYYDLLNNGNTAKFASSVPEFNIHYMKQQLNSGNAIGYGFFEYINNQLNKDIFILNGETEDLYKTDEYKLSIKHRNAIVLYYKNNHYELISCDGHTHFNPYHPFILFLKSKI